MKKDSKQTAQTIAFIINGIKSSISDFTLEELSSLLKQNKCPYWNRITTILIFHNLINKNKNKYNFSNGVPIYYSYFESSLNKIKSNQNNYSKKWKKKKIVVVKSNENNDLENAITLLKKFGYKIFKEV